MKNTLTIKFGIVIDYLANDDGLNKIRDGDAMVSLQGPFVNCNCYNNEKIDINN